MKVTTLPSLQDVKDSICEYVQKNLQIRDYKGSKFFGVEYQDNIPPTLTVGLAKGQLKLVYSRLEAADSVAMATKTERVAENASALPLDAKRALAAQLAAEIAAAGE